MISTFSLQVGEGSSTSDGFDEVYRLLLRGVRWQEGFGLFFAQQSAVGQRREILEKLQRDLPQRRIAKITLERETTKLYNQVAALYAEERFDLLVVEGIEQPIYVYEEQKRQKGWSNAEIYSEDIVNWEDVPLILDHLNQQRERFAENSPCGFLFFVPRWAWKYVVRRAPDFFDWRSGMFFFPASSEELEAQTKSLLSSNLPEYLEMSASERREQLIELTDVIELSQDNPQKLTRLLVRQARIFWVNGQYHQAIISIDQLLNLEPSNSLAWNERGICLWQLGRHQEALNDFDTSLKHEPRDISALGNKSNLLMELERYEEALRNWERLIDYTPQHSDAWLGKGRSLQKLERYEEALKSFDEASRISPGNSITWRNRGVSLERLKRYEEALKSYEKSIEISPDDSIAWRNRGNALEELERYEEALKSYEKSIEISPDDSIAWRSRGNSLEELERYEEALHSFDKAIEISPDDSIAWINRGVTLESIERYEEALESYEKGIELSPDESLPWRNRGGTLLRLQRYKEALESYEKAIELSPDNSVGWKNRGYALYNIERYEEAILSYREAIKLEPQNLSTYIGLGIIYFRQSSIEQAIQQFNRALKIHPKGTSQIWNCLGFIYLVKRKLKEAQTHFRRAAQTEGDHFLPHFNLALVSILQDKKGKKVKDIKRLLQTALDECAGKIIQEKLYIALGTIALGDPKTGLENLKNLLSTIQYPNSTLRGGILESAEIFATRPEHFPGMDQALTLIQQTLTHPTNNKSSKLNTMG